MAQGDLEKLLGGYATGTLTEEERKALFEAALHDQDLFNALADEQALKELLDDPVTRRRLLQALEQKPAPQATEGLASLFGWLRRPAGLAFAGTLATAVLAVVVVTNLEREEMLAPQDKLAPPDVQQSAPGTTARDMSDVQKVTKTPSEAQDEHDETSSLQADQRRDDAPRVAAGKSPETVAMSQDLEAGRDQPTSSPREPLLARPAPSKRQAVQEEKTEGAKPDAGAAVMKKDASSKARSRKSAPTREMAVADADQIQRQKPALTLPEPGAKPSPGPLRFRASFSQPVREGPARKLYYAALRNESTLDPGSEGQEREYEEAKMGEQRSLQDVSPEEAASAMSGLSAGVSGGVGTAPVLGLRYSLLKQAGDGAFQETNPDGPFHVNDALRLTVEVNEAGYLYVFRLGPRRGWTWITPSGPLGKQDPSEKNEVQKRWRYVIPGTGVVPLYGRPATNKMFILYTRQPQQELQVFHPAVRERLESDDAPLANLDTLLNRARIDASAQPLVVEQTSPDKPGGKGESAVYIVNPDVDTDAAIALELTFPTG